MNKSQKFRFYLSGLITLAGCIFFAMLQKKLDSQPPLQVGILMAFGFGCIFWIITSPKFFHRFVGESSAESLAIIRILVCSIAFFIILFFSDVSQTALLPESMIQPMGVMQFFYLIPGLMELSRNQVFLQILQLVTALILFLGIIGWQTRITIPLGALCFLFLGGIGRQYSYINHQGIILFDLLIVLSFTPCANALSIDSYRDISLIESNSDSQEMLSIYGWSRYACWATVAITYLITGMSKLRVGGFFWWDAINLRTKLYTCSLVPCDNVSNFEYSLKLINVPDIIFGVFGIVGLFGELGFILVLFSGIARSIFPLLMMSMHIGILFLQNILFLDFILLQLIFFDLAKIKKYIQEKLISLTGINYSISEFTFITKNDKQNSVKMSTFFYSSIISGILIVLSISWYYQMQFYPLTPWAVYSSRETSGKITYYKLNANYESGYFGSPHPEKLPYYLYNAYKFTLKNCFLQSENHGSRCKSFFQIFPKLHDRYISKRDDINTLKLEQWQWNFKKYPDDKNHGKLMDSLIYNFENNR